MYKRKYEAIGDIHGYYWVPDNLPMIPQSNQ